MKKIKLITRESIDRLDRLENSNSLSRESVSSVKKFDSVYQTPLQNNNVRNGEGDIDELESNQSDQYYLTANKMISLSSSRPQK